MRLVCKLTAVVAVGLAIQFLINRGLGPLDETQFALRAMVSHLRGGRMDDPSLIEACLRLNKRQVDRYARAARDRFARSLTQPMKLPVRDDDIDWDALPEWAMASASPSPSAEELAAHIEWDLLDELDFFE